MSSKFRRVLGSALLCCAPVKIGAITLGGEDVSNVVVAEYCICCLCQGGQSRNDGENEDNEG